MDSRTIHIMKPLCAFVITVCIINGAWSLTGFNYSRHSLFYLFNFAAFFLCLQVYKLNGIEKLKGSIINGVFLAGLACVVGLSQSSGSIRETGFFNNPNQLGYFGVVLISLTFLCKGEKYGIKEITAIISGVWSVIASLSKAAFISTIILFIFIAFAYDQEKSFKTVGKKLLLIFVGGGLVYLFFFTNIINAPALRTLLRMRTRVLNSAYENDSKLGSGRGYDRIKELGVHFLWGKGEGNYKRFSVMRGAEAHSTYASIIVSYGLIGFALYTTFILRSIVRRPITIRNLSLASGILLYSVSHNGVRNTLVWIFFATLYICGNYYEDKKLIQDENI